MLDQLSNIIAHSPNVAVGWGIGIAAFVAVLLLYLFASVVSIKRRYAFLLRHEQTQDLGNVFQEHDRRLDLIESKLGDQAKSIEALKLAMTNCVQQVGVVRYDAFEDIGGQQSFAIALLDGADNGVVFSSIYSRVDTRIYAKSLINAKSEYNLSEEEDKAVGIARQSSPRAEKVR